MPATDLGDAEFRLMPESDGGAKARRRRLRPSKQARQMRAQLRDIIRESRDAEIEPVLVSGSYRMAMLAVASGLVLLILLYVGFIGFMSYALYRTMATDPTTPLAVGIYGFTVITGPIIIFFMVKPIFAGLSSEQRPKRIKRDAEPLLYEYVDYICDAVRAPRPTSIRVMCDVNAAAGFRGGIISAFRNDLTLHIGLPLVYGLSLRQLSSVLAHEFGHFAQGGAMRLSFVIRSINFWFLRVVYQRDSWDEWLLRISSRWGWKSMVVLFPARAGVFLARSLLFCLMQCGNMLSCLLSRQQEFDADLYSTRFAGTDAFIRTNRRVTGLSIAQEFGMRDLSLTSEEGRLVDDFPQLVAANLDQITDELKEAIKEHENTAETKLFDTHPTDRE